VTSYTLRVPLVSIVTPSLNSGRFIEQTIRSVLEQSHPDIEHIVVDGGSTDTTPDVLSRYPHLHVATGPDGGQTDALIRGFRLARGDVLAWLNADDFYYPGAVATAVSTIEDTRAGLVYGACDVVDESGALVETRPPHPYDFRRELEWGSKIMQPTAFFTREAYAECGGLDPDVSLAMDYDLWLKLGRTARVEPIDRTLAAFRLTPGQRSGDGGAVAQEVRRIARRHGAPFLSWRYLARAERQHPRLAPFLYRVRYVQDRIRSVRSRAH